MTNKKAVIIVSLVELVHVIVAIKVGQSQANQCPRDDLFPMLSLIVSFIVFLSVGVIAYRKIREKKWRGIVWSLLVVLVALLALPMLWLTTAGGLNWCNYNF